MAGIGTLLKEDWYVADAKLSDAQHLVRQFHYAKGGSNTRTYTHGLYDAFGGLLMGVAWWLPPTKAAALATYPENWEGVLALSRLVVAPWVPKNACSFLLSRSMRLVDRNRWPCLVTYADEWQGHTGAIYKACNWDYVGKTKPEPVWVVDGRMVARKAGGKTRTRSEMEELGGVLAARSSKHKFVHVKGPRNERP